MKKLTAISDLIRLPKQYGTLLVLWPTLWSLFLASGGYPTAKHLAIFIFGTFLMRSAGCAINDIADRKFDPHVERTRQRPLASGLLTVMDALFVFAALSMLAFILVLFLNPFTVLLSVIGLALAAVYPFVKRVSHFPQMFLGIAFGWGAVMAWSAATNSIGMAAVLIFIANIFWSTAYDTIYALMDVDDDMRIGVKSTAIYFGRQVYAALVVSYFLTAVFLAAAGWVSGRGVFYYAGVGVAFFLFMGTVLDVKKNTAREGRFKAFLANAVIGAIVLLAIIIDLRF
ncbi:MAG: 4-hydroxybenzoate octaprenyltransferase [Deltaproteobacteria bacterium]|nr:4-hydroxybenzoate octaprenyltransferase [Deltaproteobacteria bacterium]